MFSHVEYSTGIIGSRGDSRDISNRPYYPANASMMAFRVALGRITAAVSSRFGR